MADRGRRRARTTTTGDGPTADAVWTIQEWDGQAWIDVATVRGGLASDAALTPAVAVPAVEQRPRSRVMTGRVASGQGDLTQWMERYSDAYQRVTGSTVVPGSLNVVLDQPWVMDAPDARLEAGEAGVGMGFVRCRVDDTHGWIVRTDRNNEGEGDHPQTVVEVISTVHLRSALRLHDGDEVVLTLHA